MPDTLEVRIAHLEGAYEQIDKRLAAVESAVTQLRHEISQQYSQLRGEISQQYGQLHGEISQQYAQLHGEISQLRQEMRAEISQLRQEMREQFRWILGFQILVLISVLGTALATLFRR